KSDTTTRSPETRYAAPPYSWTRERALNSSGVIRVSVPSVSRRTSTCRPLSSGRPSIHQRIPSIPCGSLRKTTRSVSRSILKGEAHDPNGAVITLRGVLRSSVAVIGSARSRAVLPRRDVLRLLRGHRLDVHPERRELQPGDLGVDRGRHAVHTSVELGVVFGHVFRG